jgi:hypothetical protein
MVRIRNIIAEVNKIIDIKIKSGLEKFRFDKMNILFINFCIFKIVEIYF